jgi:hypothetical protein
MPFADKAPTIKDMLAAVDAGTATLAEVGVVANDRLARVGKADGWYARYSALAAKCAAGEAVAVADVFPKHEPAAGVSVSGPAPTMPAQDWRALTDAVLAAAPNATTAQVAAFASKLIRANG